MPKPPALGLVAPTPAPVASSTEPYELRISSDALYPRLWDGDVVEVVPGVRMDSGNLAVVVHRDGRTWIRRVTLRARRGVVRCEPLNPSDQPFELRLSDVRLDKVVGIKPGGQRHGRPERRIAAPAVASLRHRDALGRRTAGGGE